jgi:cell wall assembly regulator SMI1
MNVDRLVEITKKKHHARPKATLNSIERFQRSHYVTLPADMKAFYSHCDGASLFEKDDPTYKLLPLSQIARARILVNGEDTDACGPESWYGFCDVRDGNYVAIDLDTASSTFSCVFDCFHETFPDPAYTNMIARSFSEFLENALNSRGQLYWLKAH